MLVGLDQDNSWRKWKIWNWRWRRRRSYQGGNGTPTNAGTGGSGVVVVRYKIGDDQYNLTGVKATGGAITKYNGKIIHAFTSSGVFHVTSGSPIVGTEVIVVGGGGGGGINSPGDGGCGGGGAGGVLYHPGKTFGAGLTYPVSIGGGGAGGQGQYNSKLCLDHLQFW